MLVVVQTESDVTVREEFDRQVDTLRRRGYPNAALGHVEPLEERLADVAGTFVIVVSSVLLARDEAIARVELAGKQGFTSMEADELERFGPIDGLEIPAASAYLVADVDTGRDTLNVSPDDALESIVRKGRSPLTIDEGIALVTHHPELLRTQNCFSMLGSRCGDRRVTALWMSRGRPRLGWCWAGNPHTWLGSASCAGRVAA
jgi:hypothetical protein